MKTLLAATCLLLSAILVPAQSVDELQKSFWERLAANDTAKDEDLRQLNKSYEAALQRLMEDFQKSGKLEEVLILRNQIANIKQDNDAAQGDEPKEPKELLPLRNKYIETRTGILGKHAAEVVNLVDRANSLLEEQIISLTKAGKIGEAVKAKTTLDKIAADKSILAARTLHEANAPAAAGWTSLTAAEMDVVKNGHSDVVWQSEPEIDKRAQTSDWARAVRMQSGKQPVLFSHASCRIRFKLSNDITRFRSGLSLAHAKGNVTFIVLVGGREIKREALSGAIQNKPFECTFPPTREIELQVNDNGSIEFDWASWINPEVR